YEDESDVVNAEERIFCDEITLSTTRSLQILLRSSPSRRHLLMDETSKPGAACMLPSLVHVSHLRLRCENIAMHKPATNAF
ncbi:unnamed protein product, partial [Ceratitis capitata]